MIWIHAPEPTPHRGNGGAEGSGTNRMNMYDVREAESRSLSVHPYSRHDADAVRRGAQGGAQVGPEDQGDAVHGRREQEEHGEDDRPHRQAAGQDQNVSGEGAPAMSLRIQTRLNHGRYSLVSTIDIWNEMRQMSQFNFHFHSGRPVLYDPLTFITSL